MKIKFKCIALVVLVLITVSCVGKPLTQEEIAARKANRTELERNAQMARPGGP